MCFDKFIDENADCATEELSIQWLLNADSQLLSAIGRPGDQNISFADRFGSALNESRHQFVNKVDSLMASGYRLANINNVTGQIDYIHPAVAYADSLRPAVKEYVKRLNNIVPVSPTGEIVPEQGQATPAPTPTLGATPAPKTVEIGPQSKMTRQ